MKNRAAAPLVVAGALLAATVLLLLLTGYAAFAVLPVLVVGALVLAASASLRTNVLLLTTLTLFGHSPQDNPAHDVWVSPLEHLGKWLLRNLSANVGVGALGFAVIDVWLLALIAAVLIRRTRAEVPPLLKLSFAGFLLAVVGAAVMGHHNGADASVSYWQVRQLVFVPVFALLLLSSFRDATDLRWLGRVVVASAAVKAVVGIYFYVVHCLPAGLNPPYVTTHHDSLHFVVALVIVIAGFLERPVAQTRRMMFLLTPLLLAVMVLNNRRLGFIALFASILVVFAMAPKTRARLQFARAGLLALPVGLLYLAAGWGSNAGVFRPVRVVQSVIEARTDDSTQSREIENRNLVTTLKRNPFGLGLGMPYDEVEKGPDISGIFPLYRHIPHNSVLWMIVAFGPLGFLMLLTPFGLSAYYAVRSHRMAVTWVSRLAAVASLAGIFGFFLQAWGDMGTRSWTTIILVSAAIAAAGKSALTSGAAAEEPVFAGGVA